MKKIFLLVYVIFSFFITYNNALATSNYESITLTELQNIQNNKSALAQVKSVSLNDSDDINNLELIKKCPNIININIEKQEIKNITVLNDMVSSSQVSLTLQDVSIDLKGFSNEYITSLYLTSSYVQNLKDIINLSKLTILHLEAIQDVSNISYNKLSNLTDLSLNSVYIENYEKLIKELNSLSLQTISLEGSNLTDNDTKYLIQLKKIKGLNISGTYVENIDFLKSLANLTDVVLSYGVSNLSVLYSLPNLESVSWDGYTELQVTDNLLKYLDSKNIYHPSYNIELKKKVEEIIASLNLNSNASIEDKIYSVSKYIAKNMRYSLEYIEYTGTNLQQFIFEGFGVCHNYSIFTYTILKEMGVPDIYYVAGVARTYPATEENKLYLNHFGGHAWNSIKINNIWYGIDNTWVSSGDSDAQIEEDLKRNVLKILSEDKNGYDKEFDFMHFSLSQPKYTLKVSPENSIATTFSFEKSLYDIRGEKTLAEIKMILPTGYELSDVVFKVEDESIAKIENYYIKALGVGKTKITAKIEDTNFITYTTINVQEPIIIDIIKNKNKATLNIDSYCNTIYDSNLVTNIQIKLINENNQNENWVTLGTNLTGVYTYDVTENSTVIVRWISTSLIDNKVTELYAKTVTIDGLGSTNIDELPENPKTAVPFNFIIVIIGIFSLIFILYIKKCKQKYYSI